MYSFPSVTWLIRAFWLTCLFMLSACLPVVTSSPVTEDVVLIIPTPVISEPQVTSTAALSPTPTPSSTATAEEDHTASHEHISLVLGVFEKEPVCLAMTEILAQLLEKELHTQTEIKLYQRDEDTLYSELASSAEKGEVDLTLCFLDPAERSYFSVYAEQLGQIGAPIWDDEQGRLLVIANAKMKTKLEEEQSCIFHLLEHLDFVEYAPEAQSTEGWIKQYRSMWEVWVNCENGGHH